jgi:hypothetical protein
MSSQPAGYELAEGDGLATSVRQIVGSIERWDEIRVGLDWALNRDPTDPSFATHLSGNLWVTQIFTSPELAVFYEVDEHSRVVTYTNVVAW